MLRRLNRFFSDLTTSLKSEGSFTQNFSMVAGGKLAVAVSAFVFVPILARLYPPEAYGHFSLYNSIVSITVLVILLGYPSSYVIIKEDDDFYYLVAFQVVMILGFFGISIFVLGGIIFLDDSIHSLLFLIPIGFLINGLMTILASWNVRSGFFKLSSQLEGVGGVGIRIINVLIGWLGNGYPFGLIIGDLTGRSVADIINIRRLWKAEHFNLRMGLNWGMIRPVLFEWRNYPKFILPNSLLTQFSGHLPVYLLAFQFNKELLGYYGMAFTIFSLPIQLLSNAVAPVYLKKATDLIENGLEELQSFTKRFLSVINFLLLVPFVFLIIFSEELIFFFLGEQWVTSGFIVAVMAFPIFLELTLTPITSILQVIRKEKRLLALNVFNFVFMSFAAAFVILVELEFKETILLIMGVRLLVDLVKTYLVFKEVQISIFRYSIQYLMILIILCLIFYYVKLSMLGV